MKNLIFSGLLSLFIMNSSFSIDFKNTDYDIVVTLYDAARDESAIKAMMPEIFEVEDVLKDQYTSRIGDRNIEDFRAYARDTYNPAENEGCIVLLAKDKTIGFARALVYGKNKDLCFEIFTIDKQFRRSGYGEKFLSMLLEDIQVYKKANIVSLWAHPIANSAAIKLYKKLGFVCVEELNGLQKFVKNID